MRAVPHIALQIVGFLGAENLWCVPDVTTDALHPVQVIFVKHLLNEFSKT